MRTFLIEKNGQFKCKGLPTKAAIKNFTKLLLDNGWSQINAALCSFNNWSKKFTVVDLTKTNPEHKAYANPGVYKLSIDGEVIYIGESGSEIRGGIYARAIDFKTGVKGFAKNRFKSGMVCDFVMIYGKQALQNVEVSFHLSDAPLTYASETIALANYFTTNGHLPRLNRGDEYGRVKRYLKENK